MKKNLVWSFASVLSALLAGNVYGTVPVSMVDFVSITFESGKATITEGAPATHNLQEAVYTMRSYPKMEVSIAGHTDNTECTANACFELSQKRAQFVTDWFIAHGVDRVRINAVTGMGSGYPVGHNDIDKERAMNRRVEIFPVEP